MLLALLQVVVGIIYGAAGVLLFILSEDNDRFLLDPVLPANPFAALMVTMLFWPLLLLLAWLKSRWLKYRGQRR